MLKFEGFCAILFTLLGVSTKWSGCLLQNVTVCSVWFVRLLWSAFWHTALTDSRSPALPLSLSTAMQISHYGTKFSGPTKVSYTWSAAKTNLGLRTQDKGQTAATELAGWSEWVWKFWTALCDRIFNVKGLDSFVCVQIFNVRGLDSLCVPIFSMIGLDSFCVSEYSMCEVWTACVCSHIQCERSGQLVCPNIQHERFGQLLCVRIFNVKGLGSLCVCPNIQCERSGRWCVSEYSMWEVWTACVSEYSVWKVWPALCVRIFS